MAGKATEYGEFETDVHQVTGKFYWVWTSPGGAEHRGTPTYPNAKAALDAGRNWLRNQTIHRS